MDATAAFRLLGIAPDASADEVRAAYKRAVREFLEVGAIDEEAVASLNAARDAALGKRSVSSALALYSNGGLPATSLPAGGGEVVAYERARAATEATVSSIVRVHVSRLRHARNRAAGAASISAVVAVLPTLVRQVGDPRQIGYVGWRFLNGFSLPLAALAFVFLLRAATAARQARINERALEDLQDTFEDRASFVAVLRELRMFDPAPDAWGRESDSWDAQRIRSRVGEWITPPRVIPRHVVPYAVRRLLAALFEGNVPTRTERSASEAAFYLGSGDFTRLLLRKGVETGLITEIEHWTDHALSTSYTVNVGARRNEPDEARRA